ncbi:MAG: helix-turn-helix domain-containing protein [Clostridia bacterium]
MYSKSVGERLRKLLQIKNIKRSYLAKKVGISYNSLTNKLNGKSEFSAIEVSRIKDTLNLDVKLSYDIFLKPNYEDRNN